ncbi:hypothetical protein [Nocardiopsis sp. LOL_012]|uniref:hypothetical protein n=1 Tax=Nocardiopsis sp. LOL_012 TaxID=3345409 RepID=UPI003A87B883
MTVSDVRTGPLRRAVAPLNARWHRISLRVFMVIVLAHWAEHIVQAVQIYVLAWPIPEARGLLGVPFPWLVTSEWLHYGYALIMLTGLILLLPGFGGRSRFWWQMSLLIQVWHHFEHLLLLVQTFSGAYIGGAAAPTSLVQLVIPRVELHLLYNTLVFIPMVVAMVRHTWPTERELEEMDCDCAVEERA